MRDTNHPLPILVPIHEDLVLLPIPEYAITQKQSPESNHPKASTRKQAPKNKQKHPKASTQKQAPVPLAQKRIIPTFCTHIAHTKIEIYFFLFFKAASTGAELPELPER